MIRRSAALALLLLAGCTYTGPGSKTESGELVAYDPDAITCRKMHVMGSRVRTEVCKKNREWVNQASDSNDRIWAEAAAARAASIRGQAQSPAN